MPIQTFAVSNQLHGNPSRPLAFSKTAQGQDKPYEVACPTSTRALVALMDMEAVMGGAASHFGGPAAFAEMMSATYAYMFEAAREKGQAWHELFHFVNDAGHCENGLYALKANYGVADLEIKDLSGFRSIESPLTGHGETHLFPQGVSISNGPLGSGLPQAQGLAISEGLSQSNRTTVVAISDGGCMEGEAKEAFAAIPGFAKKGQLGPFVCLLSDNNTKLSGRIDEDAFSMDMTFESMAALGWNVIKLEDGHDLDFVMKGVESAFAVAQANPHQPVLLWVKTIKGKGVSALEKAPSGGHGFPLKTATDLPAFLSEIYENSDVPELMTVWADRLIAQEGDKPKSTSTLKKQKIQIGVSDALIAAVKEKSYPVISVSADLQGSTGVATFRKEFPNHSVEVGVAESNMMSTAIGLSKCGYIPVVDTFAQFGVTKGALPLIMSGLSQGPMIGVFSHTGFQDAADGASHQALSYVSMVGSIPNVDVYCLSCSDEAYALMTQALDQFHEDRSQGRVPRTSLFFLGRENFPLNYNEKVNYKLGQATVEGDELTGQEKSAVIVTTGSLVAKALQAQKELKDAAIGSVVINMSSVNHPDVDTVQNYLEKTSGLLFTMEDHRVELGLGAAVTHHLMRSKRATRPSKVVSLGVSDQFGRSAYKADQLYANYGIDDQALVNAVKSEF